jgi:hypothetical protein
MLNVTEITEVVTGSADERFLRLLQKKHEAVC